MSVSHHPTPGTESTPLGGGPSALLQGATWEAEIRTDENYCAKNTGLFKLPAPSA